MSKKLNSQKRATERSGALAQCRPLLPALVAFGGVVSTPALALELGPATIESGLGQPLRASIAYALNPGENLQNLCIFLRPASPNSGVPAVTNARLSLRNDRILVTGRMPVNEPLIGLNVSIECPSMPRLSREYTLFVDPVSNRVPEAEPVVASVIETQQPSPIARPASAVRSQPVASNARKPVAPRASGASLAQGSQYRVQVGDTLSTIAARVEGRPSGVWKTVNVLFAANPEAFYDNNVDRLKAGSLLTIPVLSGEASAMPAQAEQEAPSVAQVAVVEDFAEAMAETEAPVSNDAVEASVEPADEIIAVVADLELSATAPAASVEADAGMAPNTTLSVEEANPFVAETQTLRVDDNETTAAVTGGELRVATEEQGGLSWWPILTGAAVGVFIALGLFGRSILRRFRPGGGAAFHTPEFDPTLSSNGFVPERRKAPRKAEPAKAAAKAGESAEEFQARLDATSAELEKVSAELSERPEVFVEKEEPAEVAEDEASTVDFEAEELEFAAAASTDLDITLEETTINDEVDFELLQQDYEAELTATQAIRLADAQAAIEALSAGESDAVSADTVEVESPVGPDDETVQMPAALEAALSIDESLVAEIDTALLEGLDNESGDDNETDATMQLPVDKLPRGRKKKVSNG